MNYNELTDFEINKLVAEKAGHVVDCDAVEGDESHIFCSKDNGLVWFVFDPCNNPSDAKQTLELIAL